MHARAKSPTSACNAVGPPAITDSFAREGGSKAAVTHPPGIDDIALLPEIAPHGRALAAGPELGGELLPGVVGLGDTQKRREWDGKQLLSMSGFTKSGRTSIARHVRHSNVAFNINTWMKC